MAARINLRQICLDLIFAEDENEVLRILERTAGRPGRMAPARGDREQPQHRRNQQSSATAALVEKLINGSTRSSCSSAASAASTPIPPGAADHGGSRERLLRNPGREHRPAEALRPRTCVRARSTDRDRHQARPQLHHLDLGEANAPATSRRHSAHWCGQTSCGCLSFKANTTWAGAARCHSAASTTSSFIVQPPPPLLVQGQTGCDKDRLGLDDYAAARPGRRPPIQLLRVPDDRRASPLLRGAELPIRPTREQAYEGPLQWGTLIKLYNFQIEYRSTVVFDLNFEPAAGSTAPRCRSASASAAITAATATTPS